jgi:hypothetical protein
MGTNFYVRGHRYDDDPAYHIGKRSAAGWYCWDCRVTLCKGGISMVHRGSSQDDFYEACPKCGKKPIKESLDESAAGRELGWNKSDPRAKTGVRSCSSFSWCMPPGKWKGNVRFSASSGRACHEYGKPWDNPDALIEDEYGCPFTIEEFEAVLSECPIRFFDGVGQWFS